jgi:hypothetical protein
MAGQEFSGFVGGAYETRSKYQDAQRCINWYPEVDPTPGAASVMALLPTPGKQLYVSSGTVAPVRGCYVAPSDRTTGYFVVGPTLYRVVDGPTPAITALGTLDTAVGPVSMNDNGVTMVLVDGPFGYTVNLANGAFAKIVDPAFYGSTRVAYLDSFLIFNRRGTRQFYITGQGTVTFDALDFAEKAAQPDLLVAPWEEHRELWLFGQLSTEVWYNNGGADFPFTRLQGAFLQHGLAAPFSLSRLGETFAWVGTDERGAVAIWRANGYQPDKISTSALDAELATYPTVADAIAFTYRGVGHEFYVVTFPTADKTWVYDAVVGLWHQRASMDQQGDLHRDRANCFMNLNGRLIVGDYKDGNLYELKNDVYTDAGGRPIPRIRRCPHIISNRNEVSHHSLQIVFEPGVGTQTGQGKNPQASLRWSNDGGSTWSNEHFTEIGPAGQYKRRAIWRRLGMARDRIYEVRVTDPVFAAVISAQLDLTPGYA